jgi:hypothetical protein
LDPSELYPKPKKSFKEKHMTAVMLDIKYESVENKRRGTKNINFLHSLNILSCFSQYLLSQTVLL